MSFLFRVVTRRFPVPYRAISSDSSMSAKNIIEFDDLKAKLNAKNVTLIDVREPQELKDDGKIPGSVNIPLGTVEEAFKLPPDTFQQRYGVKMPSTDDSDVVFSCKAGRRAMTAAEKLAPLGYTKTKVYSGSFKDWLEKQGPVEK